MASCTKPRPAYPFDQPSVSEATGSVTCTCVSVINVSKEGSPGLGPQNVSVCP